MPYGSYTRRSRREKIKPSDILLGRLSYYYFGTDNGPGKEKRLLIPHHRPRSGRNKPLIPLGLPESTNTSPDTREALPVSFHTLFSTPTPITRYGGYLQFAGTSNLSFYDPVTHSLSSRLFPLIRAQLGFGWGRRSKMDNWLSIQGCHGVWQRQGKGKERGRVF